MGINKMSNIKRLNLDTYPSFITTKTIDNYPYFQNHDNAEILVSAIYFGRTNNWFYLIAFVIMPDHLHIIIAPRQKHISQAMHSLKSFSSQEINRLQNRNGRVWQPSFRDFTIYDGSILLEKVSYIHNNPVRRGFVPDPTRYNYSSANPVYETDLEINV